MANLGADPLTSETLKNTQRTDFSARMKSFKSSRPRLPSRCLARVICHDRVVQCVAWPAQSFDFFEAFGLETMQHLEEDTGKCSESAGFEICKAQDRLCAYRVFIQLLLT